MSPSLRYRTTRPLQCHHQTKVKVRILGKVYSKQSKHLSLPAPSEPFRDAHDSLYRRSQRELRGLQPLSLGAWGQGWLKGNKGRQGWPSIRGLSDRQDTGKVGTKPTTNDRATAFAQVWATDRPGVTLADARSEVPPHSYSLAKLSNTLSLSLPPPL